MSSDLTFVCCVESGPLEEMTIRLVESLRRFGGELASSRVIAVQPRKGPALGKSTRRRFDELGVSFERLKGGAAYAWYHFLNKPRSLLHAERLADTEWVAFLDSDVLVVAEPLAGQLGSEVDFVAKPELGSIETKGAGGTYEVLWREYVAAAGLGLEDLPWVTEPQSGEQIRLYFNSGVFAYRRRTSLAAEYLRIAEAILDKRIACAQSGVHWIEQASLGLAAVSLGARLAALPASDNFSLHGWGRELENAPIAEDVRLLHYHNAMSAEPWPRLLKRLEGWRPELHEWLSDRGPVSDSSPLWSRAVKLGLRVLRGRDRSRFLAECRVVQ